MIQTKIKKLFSLFVAIIITGVFMNIAEAATPKITLMEIYPRGARVIYSVPASQSVSVEIPGIFDINSIKPVSKSGQKLNFFFKKTVDTTAVPANLQPLYNKIVDINKKIAVAKAQIVAHTNNLTLVNTIKTDGIKAVDVNTYLSSTLDHSIKSNNQIALLNIEIADLSKQLNELNREYNQKLPQNYNVVTNVSVGSSDNSTIEIEAFTYSSTWSPSYKMNLNSKTGKISASLIANASQNMGIDYEGVINFYTQQPVASDLYMPTLRPLVVNLAEEYNVNRDSKRMMNQMAAAPAFEMMAKESAAPIQMAPVSFSSPINTMLKGKGRLMGDGTTAFIELGKMEYDGKLSMVLAREIRQEATLVANITSLKEAMLPGYAELSVDDQPSGNTRIYNAGIGTDVKIPFGIMPLVKVLKETNVAKTSSGGIFAGTIEDGYRLEVSNGFNLDADIELIDRIPTSANSKITVEKLKIEPKPDSDKDNLMKWHFKLKPGEKRTFVVEYKIKHPSDKELSYSE